MDSIWCYIVSAFQWTWGYDLGKVLLIGLALIYMYGAIADIKDMCDKTKNKIYIKS